VRSRRIGSITVLLPPERPAAEALASCLESVQNGWERDGQMAALWRAWPGIAGPQLAPHCRPLRFQGGVLTVGAAPGAWLQALQYNRHQLLGALRGAGFSVRDLRLEQHHGRATATPGGAAEAAVWAAQPSRVDVHGLGRCPACGAPAPAGELTLWGHCSFCRRINLS
jgi:predicted nucleic acid-binding Zn ribbon protein